MEPHRRSMRIRTKLCGFTRVEDVQAATAAGTDALGFVFYPPSPRAITIPHAQQLLKWVPPFVTSVALFVNPEADQVWRALSSYRWICCSFMVMNQLNSVPSFDALI